jgi:hypothetical protein
VSERVQRQALLLLLEGDEELYQLMCEAELLPPDERFLVPDHLEIARVVGTLVHELEVNWAGVEVILRLRSELVATRRQVAEFLALLRRGGPGGAPPGPA